MQNYTAKDRYKLLIGTIIPRPIALVTTVAVDGPPTMPDPSAFSIS